MADELELDLEQEEIRSRIDESRDALVQKIEQLEERVTDTVESATATVAEATEAVRETVQNATASVSETVDSVAGAMQGTAETVRDSVEGVVDAVKDALDFSRMVDRYPWVMVAGAFGVGYLAGRTLNGSSARQFGVNSMPYQVPPPREAMFASEVREQSYPGTTNGSALDLPLGSRARSASPPLHQPSMFESLVGAFQPEISKLSGLAIGMGFDSLKQILLKNVPAQMKEPLSSMIDDVNKRMGGESLPDATAR